jgi:hypothetical protein
MEQACESISVAECPHQSYCPVYPNPANSIVHFAFHIIRNSSSGTKLNEKILNLQTTQYSALQITQSANFPSPDRVYFEKIPINSKIN